MLFLTERENSGSNGHRMVLCTIVSNFLNNGQIQKIQNSTESAELSLFNQSDNPQVSLIRTKCWGQTGADYWKFTV